MSATPVSTERVRDLLSSRDLNFGEYSEAELVVPTRNAVYFWNTSNPQILQVRAQWRGIAEDDTQFGALVDEIANCNSRKPPSLLWRTRAATGSSPNAMSSRWTVSPKLSSTAFTRPVCR